LCYSAQIENRSDIFKRFLIDQEVVLYYIEKSLQHLAADFSCGATRTYLQ